MTRHFDITASELRKKIRQGVICFGGNARLRIYGRLDCASGKRIKRENRVFFSTEQEATRMGFRPCGHCKRTEYKKWTDTGEV